VVTLVTAVTNSLPSAIHPSLKDSMAEPNDGEAVRRIRQGDEDAFRVLVTRYRKQYGRYAVALTGDIDSAADAMQEAFIRAWHSLDACRDPERFGSWFFRILTNQCHTVRGRRRDTDDVDALELAGPGRADESLDRSELADALEEALGRLTDEQREAFVLKHVDGRSYEEMAELLGTGVDALKMRVHRAREALRSMMGALR
jgi:RNA polymerase sigma-70 factor (ECF subfamily)